MSAGLAGLAVTADPGDGALAVLAGFGARLDGRRFRGGRRLGVGGGRRSRRRRGPRLRVFTAVGRGAGAAVGWFTGLTAIGWEAAFFAAAGATGVSFTACNGAWDFASDLAAGLACDLASGFATGAFASGFA